MSSELNATLNLNNAVSKEVTKRTILCLSIQTVHRTQPPGASCNVDKHSARRLPSLSNGIPPRREYVGHGSTWASLCVNCGCRDNIGNTTGYGRSGHTVIVVCSRTVFYSVSRSVFVRRLRSFVFALSARIYIVMLLLLRK